MKYQTANDQYLNAMRKGQKEYRDLIMAGKDPNPPVLDELPGMDSSLSVQELGYMDIPAERIVGTKTAGRMSAFTPSFLPTLSPRSEFGMKWIMLCEAHLSDEGIRDPILCYEYLGNFYVQEGNKRVSVLKYFGAPRIPSYVKRVLPPLSDDPRVKAYYEFLDFYHCSRLYTIQFRRPGDYARLLHLLKRKPDEVWTDEERRYFNSCFQFFREIFESMNNKNADVLPEEALLVWLEVYPFRDLLELTTPQLKNTLERLWESMISANLESVNVQTKAVPSSGGIFSRLLSSAPDQIHVAFVHQLNPKSSTWAMGHEDGRKHIEEVFGERIIARSYCGADNAMLADSLIDEAVAEGAQVVFTTAPLLSKAALRATARYPQVQFFNCSVDQPYSGIRTYYGRIYEAKFITGAIAGAMANDDRIGYIASYPIFGVPASINAFALGAQLTNPRATVDLRWSCCQGNHQSDFFRDGIRVFSNRDVPTDNQLYLDFCNYGTYELTDEGDLISYASPVWSWGKFYEFVLRSMFSGTWKQEKNSYDAINYWLGMDSGVISLQLSEHLPEGVRVLARMLEKGIIDGSIAPFHRRIVAQDGTVKNDGSQDLSPQDLLRMDWLCENVNGQIPDFEQILPMSQAMVRELGIYRETLAPQEEGAL